MTSPPGLWTIPLNVVSDGFAGGGMVTGGWRNAESWEEGMRDT